MPPRSTPPEASEHLPYYARYVALVPPGDVLATLAAQHAETQALLGGLSEAQALHRYGPDKWSVKEVVGHLADTERVFAYRALRFLRGDPTPLAGFEQDDFVRAAGSDARPLADLLAEFAHVRAATLALFGGADAEAWGRGGSASGGFVTVRALAWIIAGHERHHVAVLRERYGLGSA